VPSSCQGSGDARSCRAALSELEAQIVERDRLDSTRTIAPLVQADDATELITDGMGIEAVIDALEDLFRGRVAEEVWPTPEC